MASVLTSRYVPRVSSRLDWRADPLYRLRGSKVAITGAQTRTGLDYNKRLYQPSSAEMADVFGQRPNVVYPKGWQNASMSELGQMLTRFGSGGRPGVASVSYPVAPGTMPAATPLNNLVTTQPVTDGAHNPGEFTPDTEGAHNPYLTDTSTGEVQSPWIGAAGPTGETGPTANTGIAPQEGIYEDSRYPGKRFNPDGTPNFDNLFPSNGGKASGDNNPLNNIGVTAPEGRDNSTTGQTQRYYDRKFAKMSHDPVDRTFARRIDASAPNVSRPLNPVHFNNNVAGHSDWQAY